MGEAKRRGTFAERKARALARNERIARKTGRAKLTRKQAQFVAVLAGLAGSEQKLDRILEIQPDPEDDHA